MPTLEGNDNGDNTQAALIPVDSNPEGIDLRRAQEQSAQWTGLSSEERHIVIQGEIVLANRRRHSLDELLQIGHAVVVFSEEVMRQSNSTSPQRRRYSGKWKELAPPQLSDMHASDRNRTAWLWHNREAVSEWWAAVEGRERDRWSNPLSIKQHYERDLGIAHGQARDDDEDTQIRDPDDTTRRRQGMLATAEDMLRDGRDVIDVMREAANAVAHVTGIQQSPLLYDLSSPELAAESADNFAQVYGGQYGDDGLTWFVEAVVTRIPRGHAAALVARLVDTYRPDAEIQDATFRESLRQTQPRRRRRSTPRSERERDG
jgi:hypothetical protein